MSHQTNYLSPEDFEKFLDVETDPVYKIMFRVLYGCALRISECLSLMPQDFNLKRRILTIQKAKTGRNQKTSIIPTDIKMLESYLEMMPANKKLFKISRQSAWSHSKDNGNKAGLDLFEQQKIREIEGAWTHLFRKSRAKLMEDMGCKISIIQVKLRHSHRESIDHYIQSDINALIEWERVNYT